VVGGQHLHPGSVAESQTVRHVKDERLELEGQVHMQESSNPTATSHNTLLKHSSAE